MVLFSPPPLPLYFWRCCFGWCCSPFLDGVTYSSILVGGGAARPVLWSVAAPLTLWWLASSLGGVVFLSLLFKKYTYINFEISKNVIKLCTAQIKPNENKVRYVEVKWWLFLPSFFWVDVASLLPSPKVVLLSPSPVWVVMLSSSSGGVVFLAFNFGWCAFCLSLVGVLLSPPPPFGRCCLLPPPWSGAAVLLM